MTLQEQNSTNSTNKLQTCFSCRKSLPIKLYFNDKNDKNNKLFRTCIYCRTNQQKKSKHMQENDNVKPVTQFIDFDEFLDFYSELLEEFTKNKENVDDFQINIACIIDSSSFIGLLKEITNKIIKQVSEVDD